MRELFLQRVPSNIRMILTPSATDLNVDQLAQLAERIVEALPTPTIATADDPTAHLKAQVHDLNKRFDELTSTLESTTHNLQSCRRSRSPSPWRRRRRFSSSADEDNNNLCWYQWTFGW